MICLPLDLIFRPDNGILHLSLTDKSSGIYILVCFEHQYEWKKRDNLRKCDGQNTSDHLHYLQFVVINNPETGIVRLTRREKLKKSKKYLLPEKGDEKSAQI